MNEVFILAMPRSASTALQVALNACSSDLIIYGEHFQFLKGLPAHLSNAKCSVPRFHRPVDTKEDIKNPPTNFPYVHANGVDGGMIVARLKTYIEDTLNPLRYARWGFKDVSYGFDEGAMLLELFPTCKLLLNVRHPADVIASGIGCCGWPDWAEDDWFSHWEVQHKAFCALTKLSARAETVYYEQLVCEPKVIRHLCEWLELDSAPAEDFIFSHPKWGPTPESSKPVLSASIMEKIAVANYPVRRLCQ